MITEQNKKDILDLYCEGYSVAEICEEYEGLDPRLIKDICAEEDASWNRI